jgi:hypothetical protein
MTTTEDVNPAASFAGLMAGASDAAAPAPDAAPFGWTTDRQTGQRRPKQTAGRPKKSDSLEELMAPDPPPAAAPPLEGAGDAPPPADRAPDDSKRRHRRVVKQKSDAPVPPYRPGFVTAGVNRLYRRAGKIVRAMDSDIGTAVIESARNSAGPGEPDDSVGAAWDDLCRTNPRVRAFVMKALMGGAWGQLVMAHAPIAMAVLMKPQVARHIPFQGLVASMAEPDEDSGPGEGGLPGGMTEADAQQMAGLARQQMQRMGMQVDPQMAAQMEKMAAGMMGPNLVPSGPPGPGNPPPAFARSQPRRASGRSARHN